MKLADLKLNPDNPRNIKEEKLDKLAQSIKDFPKMMVKRPIVYDENKVIIGGNMRYRAIQKLGMDEIPDEWTSDASDFTPDERHRFIMQDNAEMGEHDWDMVANQYELEDLAAWGIDVPGALLGDESDIEEDEAPEVSSEPPVSQSGSIYQLGRHKVMCGSATEPADVKKLIGGQTIGLIHTDPPYGVDYKSKKLGGIMNDTLKDDSLYQLVFDAFTIAKEHLDPNAGIYCWYEDKYRHTFQTALEDSGYEFKQNLVWNKGMNLSGADYQKAHENVLYLQLQGGKAKWYGGRDKKTILGKRRTDVTTMKKQDLIAALVAMQSQSTVWDIDRDTVTTYVHPTQKPVTISARAILNSSQDEDYVYDGFMGSGSTLIACEQTGRTCYGMELDPKYVDVIRKRYAKFINNNELPENWEELTPAIQGESRE